MTKTFLYPFFLFLLVLVIDQPVNIASLRNPGRPDPTEHELTATYLAGAFPLLKDRGRTVLFVGSSRSMMMSNVDASFIAKDPLITASDREALKDWHFDITGAFPGANLLVQLVVLDALVQSGYRPDLLVVETAPEFLNQAFVESEYDKNIYDADFLVRHAGSFPRSMQVDAGVRLLFPSYRYKFRIEKAVLSGFKDDFEFRRGLMTAVLANRTSYRSSTPREDHGQDDYLSAEQTKAFTAQMNEMAKLSQLARQQALERMMRSTLQMGQRAGIRTVLWVPAVTRLTAKAVYTNQEHLDAFERVLADVKLPVVRGGELLSRCDRWEDSVHLSRKCNGILAAALLRAAP